MYRPVCKGCVFKGSTGTCDRGLITGIAYQESPYKRGQTVCGGKMTAEQAEKAGISKQGDSLRVWMPADQFELAKAERKRIEREANIESQMLYYADRKTN
jgi:adenylate kinase